MVYRIRDKIQFLSEASKILSSSLDYNTTLATVARLVVANFADFCMIDLLDKEGVLQRAAAQVANIKKRRLAEEMLKYPADPRNKGAIYEVVRKGKSILIEESSQEWLREASKISEEREIIRKLGLHSFIFVPLISRGNIIGVLTLVSSDPDLSFNKDDLSLAEELASRAGLAVDNARLFSEVQEALKHRQIYSNMLESIYNSALRFLIPQSLEVTYKIAVNEAIRLTGAKYGTIRLEQNSVLQKVYTNLPRGTNVSTVDDYVYKCFKTGRAQILSFEVLEKKHPEMIKAGIKYLIFIPLAHQNKSIGVLTLRGEKIKHLKPEQLNVLQVFGGLVSLAIEKTKLYYETQSALRLRDLFISMAAHELRTPTTTIQGYAQMIQKNQNKKEATPRKWIDILLNETKRLNNLLQELLQLSQVRTGQLKYNWRANSLSEIIERVIAVSQMTHPKYKITFINMISGSQDKIYSDFDKLMQAIINLVNNAAKFSKPESEIKIKLYRTSSSLVVAVEDQGVGISKRDLPHVFEGFYKGKNNTRQGMGLGLFLAENVVQSHGGFININSKIRRGTTAEIVFPSK